MSRVLPARCSAEEELLLGSGVRVHVSAGQVGAVGEPAVVAGCCWRARERLLFQVENAGRSFPQARRTSANTLTMLFGLGFFCTAFFFFLFFLLCFFFSSRSAETSAHRRPKQIILTTQARENLISLFSGGRIEAVGWQDLPNTMVRVGRQGCTRGCTSLTPAPLQREERLQRSIKMHELVLSEPAGICWGWLW